MSQEDRIRRYWHGQLSAHERQALEDELVKDSALAREFHAFRELQQAIAKEEAAALKQRLAALPPARPRLSWRWIAVAASLLLLLGAAWYHHRSAAPSPAALYARYYEPYPNVWQPLVRNQAPLDNLSLALAAYEQGQYAAAEAQLQALATVDAAPELYFYLGLSQLHQGKLAQASTNLAKAKQAPTYLQAPLRWYQALIQLRREDLTAARQSLIHLQQNYPDFRPEDVADLLVILADSAG
ncbi:MAG: hypothetical protein D6772_10180 [Bacteroidetes bacterium]|nr:MAG: hypothetical protein D6772_10180 [Bacteroidota bacterium]